MDFQKNIQAHQLLNRQLYHLIIIKHGLILTKSLIGLKAVVL